MNNTTYTQTLHFEDGRTFDIPSSWPSEYGDYVDGLDADGYPCHIGGGKFYIGLTMCCGASFKGLEHYVGCRHCYAPAEGNDMPREPIAKRVYK